MNFETKKEVLDWYERQPRTLTKEFIENIAWSDVRNYEINHKFIPVLFYMRDVEVLTDMYYKELRRTPTGKDPVISKFMERWGVEEITHGEVINRFLNEAGIETSKNWKEKVQKSVSRFYKVNTYLLTTLTKLIGKEFTATHMTFGAIHEMSTGQGYRRLTAILREESAHTKFYTSIARIELQKSRFARKVARFVVNNFWAPVGQGSRPKEQTHYTINTLFNDREGLECIDRTISNRVQSLPGFEGLNKISEHIRQIVSGSELKLST
jgi:hypothetical protein